MGTRLQWTYADYVLLPDDGKRHEIIEGEHFTTPAPFLRHQRVCLNIAGSLRAHALRSRAGEVFIAPTDVVLSDEDVVQPDVLFIAAARSSIITEKNISGAPDLVVEVLSESTRKTDMAVKRKLYEARGVREYWIVDPELETVLVYRAGEGESYSRAAELSLESGGAVETPLLPGFLLPLAEIFA
jgi:Uma2 family endonuclease